MLVASVRSGGSAAIADAQSRLMAADIGRSMGRDRLREWALRPTLAPWKKARQGLLFRTKEAKDFHVRAGVKTPAMAWI
jgi:hypothetical protein